MKLRFLLGFIVFAIISLSCTSQDDERVIYRQQPNPAEKQDVDKQLAELNSRIKALELFASSYTSGAPAAFSDCNALTSASEKKICQIATSVSDASSLEIKSSLATAAKGFQETLYGADCLNAVDAGCPVAGSILSDLAAAKANIATNSADISSIKTSITALQTSVTGLTTRMTAIENRFNAFNGTSQSIETIVTGIKSDISALQSDVAELKGVIAPSRTVNKFLLCGDNADSGPIFEIILISGDKTEAYGTVKTGTWYGTALFFKAGDTNLFTSTHLNSKACNFKMYNDATNTKIQACWVKTNRSANAAQIDAARTAATATCTPY